MDRGMWKRLAGGCDGGLDCEGILLTERGIVAVQGGHLADTRTPPGEAVVEISSQLLQEAANALG